MNDSDISTEMTTEGEKTNVVSLSLNILTSPQEAFISLQSRPSILFPLLLILLSSALVSVWYFSVVDFAWYIDDTIARLGNMSDEQLEQIGDYYSNSSATAFAVRTALSGSIALLVMYVLQAGYLALASSLNGDGYRFKNWFSLICWTNLPYLLVVLVMAVNILLSPNGQFNILDANSLSLSSLGMKVQDNSLLQVLLDVLTLPMFWSIALVVMAYKQWVGSSLFKALAVVLAPYTVIFGIWAYFALT